MLTHASTSKNVKDIVWIAFYVDDNLMVGDINAINNTTSALKNNRLVLKVVEGLQDYLFCKMIFSED